MTSNPVLSANHKYTIVVVDYFTKWAKSMLTYEKIAKITAQFLINHVIARFCIPKDLVSDHRKHFKNEVFEELSHHLGFSHEFASPYYPQSNRQVEAINKVLKAMLQRMVNNHKTNRHQMLFSALWAYCTTVKTSTSFTPFHLVYGIEVVIPIGRDIPNLHTSIELLDDTQPLEKFLVQLELVDENR